MNDTTQLNTQPNTPLNRPSVRADASGENYFQVPGQSVTITAILQGNPTAGCMVVEVFIDSTTGTRLLRTALFVGPNASGWYTPMSIDSCWLIDLPGGLATERDDIRRAIVQFQASLKGKPPGPPEWHPK
jgi:hypothetical protein